MSASSEPANHPKPVVKDKNPHNYRKVGYSMIVISVSLVVIALLVWAIGDDYHYSSNIMGLQEIDAMTPKSGYNIVMFDISQPVGAKLKMLDHAGDIDTALSLQAQDAKQNAGNTIQILLFNGSKDYNLQLMSDAEVYIQTPTSGYNVVLYQSDLSVGQKITLGIHEELLANATSYQQQQIDNLKGTPVQALIFTPDYRDNLKTITGSSVPVGFYATVPNYTAPIVQNMTQTSTNQTVASTNSSSTTTVQLPPSTSNQTNVSTNQTAVSNNQTMTTTNSSAMNNTATTVPNMTMSNMTTTNAQTKGMVTISSGAADTKGQCSDTDCFNPQDVTVNVGDTVTWINSDTVGHTATSGKVTDNQTGTVFDSSLIQAGKSYTSPAFKTAGTYNYFCQVHPWMTGEVIVAAGSSSQPSGANATGSVKTINLNETVSVNATGK
ncbi:MAG TPA: plastocyanin/azurin family copper-binding protein [Candidatus Nitrosotalea sp.]|nr:plastocyanin/azurin family copper-binding protein [Candidatus Nitrosotalea sp.]